MNRESRANLIFLAIFLVVSIPGLIVLIKKKSDPAARPMWLPDNVKSRLVYIDPVDAPPSVPRMSPAITAGWVLSEAQQRFAIAQIPISITEDGSSLPVMSTLRYFQFIGTRRTAEGVKVFLLGWNLPRNGGKVAFDITNNGQPAQFEHAEMLVPPNIKRDLEDSGLAAAPQRVWWITVSLPSDAAPEVSLRLAGAMESEPFLDTLSFRAD